jgi:DNA-binding NarL/FixJ family response regulator
MESANHMDVSNRAITVFLVDDSLIVRARIMTMLGDLERVQIIGHAPSSEEAGAAIRMLNPDIVILDVQLPGASGIELLKEIKKFRPAPITMMFTNFPFAQIRKECIEAGADYFFDKSRDFEKITQVLGSMVEQRAVS